MKKKDLILILLLVFIVLTIALIYMQYQKYSVFLAPTQCNEIRPGNFCAIEGDGKNSDGPCKSGESLCGGKVCCAADQICRTYYLWPIVDTAWCEDTKNKCDSLGQKTCGETDDTTKCCPLEKTCIYQKKYGKKTWKCGATDKNSCEQSGGTTCPKNGTGHEEGFYAATQIKNATI